MNRLILIGNGFDLAHKLKTSYYDFILDYLETAFKIAKDKGEYNDELIKVTSSTAYISPELNNISDVTQFLFYKIENLPDGNMRYANQMSNPHITTPAGAYKLSIKNNFFNTLLSECGEYKWVDIENRYYKELLQILDVVYDEKKQQKVERLNNTLTYLIQKLESYLKSQMSENYIPELAHLLFEKISRRDIVYSDSLSFFSKDIGPKAFHFLNFNYTNTLEKYVGEFNSLGGDVKASINYIHGQVESLENPIIFGFGDELDVNYSRIEAELSKGFLKFIKSFWYFKTPCYHDLIRFIESDDFQVYVVGHSCGLSDRTMLNMIFEHGNCKSIKVFYHENSEGNNFTELTEEISRHFTNKKEMRKKIAHFKISHSFPQLS